MRNKKVRMNKKAIKILKEIPADEVVSIFLKSEVESPRHKGYYLEALEKDRHTVAILKDPDLESEEENKYRSRLLGKIRGFGHGKLLFENFPKDTRWFRAKIAKEELLKVRYILWCYWSELSGGSRLPMDAAEMIRKGTTVFGESNDKFFELAEEIRRGRELPELIFVSTYDEGEILILEGHNRMTAFALLGPDMMPENMQIILGLSRTMDKWGDFSRNPFRKGLPTLTI